MPTRRSNAAVAARERQQAMSTQRFPRGGSGFCSRLDIKASGRSRMNAPLLPPDLSELERELVEVSTQARNAYDGEARPGTTTARAVPSGGPAAHSYSLPPDDFDMPPSFARADAGLASRAPAS